MAITPTYPGVYIEELPSGVRTITGVATSITAFIGRARRGPVNEPVRIQSFADFDRQFGGLWTESTMSYAVRQYFLHGGTEAIIVRVNSSAAVPATSATIDLGTGELTAVNPGEWGNALQAVVDNKTRDPDDVTLFNLTINELDSVGGKTVVNSESFINLSVVATDPRFVTNVLAQESNFVNVTTFSGRPTDGVYPSADDADAAVDGDPIEDDDLLGDDNERTGVFALEDVDLFNLLCIPPPTFGATVSATSVLFPAAKYCQDRRALLLIDPPADWSDPPTDSDVNTLRSDIGSDLAINAAVYYPALNMPDPENENRLSEFVPCGAVAGIMARTDAQRGIWKAPAGLDASFGGVQSLSYRLTDGQNGILNPLGLNCLRTFPVYGNVVWGARTLAGADALASEWKYIPVRRFALFIEESLFRGTQWVVFEPNDEPLWAQIRLNLGAFMQTLFRQGAFQGATRNEAYFVKCDSETTTQNDIDQGKVNVVVGFAPLKPAEFVIIKIQQIAGQLET